MKYQIDLHVHSNVSTHAYSSLEELVAKAKINNVKGFALTNHGPSMPDAPHEYHFANMKILPDIINDIRVYRGIEANIISEDGSIDFPLKYDNYLEIILAGFHNQTLYGDGENIVKNTNAVINCIKNGYVDILAHLGNPQYPIDYELVIKKAALHGVAIEINNSSFIKSRTGSYENCIEIAKLCKKYNTPISLGSDTHISTNIGNLNESIKIIKKSEIDENQIINYSFEKLNSFLKKRRENRRK